MTLFVDDPIRHGPDKPGHGGAAFPVSLNTLYRDYSGVAATPK
jgi:hypothetical protein